MSESHRLGREIDPSGWPHDQAERSVQNQPARMTWPAGSSESCYCAFFRMRGMDTVLPAGSTGKSAVRLSPAPTGTTQAGPVAR